MSTKHDLLFRSWFAGLVAGEAYFRIHKSKGGEYFACHFGIHMRADETPMLFGLKNKTGAGVLKFEDARIGKSGIRSQPGVRWIVQSREDCLKIARLLDGVPLYGKKQRDYDLWRRALAAWCSQERGNRWRGPASKDTMARLYEEMKSLRVYDHDAMFNARDPFEVRRE